MFFPTQDRIFQIEVTTQCNLKCEGCSRTVGIHAQQWKNQHIALDVFEKAIAQARPAQAIILQGIGEPTLHPQLPELISIAKNSGKFHTISFYTNGLARSIEYYDDLKQRGHNHVTVSVDSLTQSVADICRAGTDVSKLLQRVIELYHTHAPNLNISLVLSRKNLFDCFTTLLTLNKIADAGGEPITVFIQKMISTSDDIERDFIVRPEDDASFKNKMRELKPTFSKLRIGLCGDLNTEAAATTAHTDVIAHDQAPQLCDKPYYDRFVTIDGFLTPCCVITDSKEWQQTSLKAPLETVFSNALPIVEWFKDYERSGNKNCKNCSLMSPLLNASLVTGNNQATA